ncbi:Lactation elevated protein 1 [Galdieria sulphuraria]|nr:Lactation elevated protein 1 [Galdieria sulphuraria]
MWIAKSTNISTSLKNNFVIRNISTISGLFQQVSDVSSTWKGTSETTPNIFSISEQVAKSEAKTVTELYQSLAATGTIQEDPGQLRSAAEFDRLLKQEFFVNRIGSFFPFLKSKTKVTSPKGIYIYGGVGSGKTFLMDMFYQLTPGKFKYRMHFQDFMMSVHKRIHQFRVHSQNHGSDPIPPVAAQVASECWLLCLDEFQVTDVADALVLRRLGEELFSRGLILVTTSNRAPEELYWNGIQRELFLPFIPLLYDYCRVLHASSQTDYRMQMILRDVSNSRQRHGIVFYVCQEEEKRKRQMDKIFLALSGDSTEKPVTLDVFSRKLVIKRTGKGIARFSFSELCDEALSAADFVVLAETFRSVLIEDIPEIKLFTERNRARRFINLIDALYDHCTKLFCSSTVELDNLFSKEDLDFSKGLEPEEFFASERTLSRLSEMQTEAYLKKPHIGRRQNEDYSVHLSD